MSLRLEILLLGPYDLNSLLSERSFHEPKKRDWTITAADDVSIKAGKTTLLDAGDQFTIQTGNAKIGMNRMALL
jgi:hypothetical protein